LKIPRAIMIKHSYINRVIDLNINHKKLHYQSRFKSPDLSQIQKK
jgi:hypothetical protein